MTEVQNVYIALAIACMIGLVVMLCIFGVAAWSVRSVNRRTANLEGKFTLLIDVLLKQAEREIAARKVQIAAEHVDVVEGYEI